MLDEDDVIDRVQDEVVQTMLRADLGSIPTWPRRRSTSSCVAKHLERVGDHATNIAEDVILVAEARNVKHAAKLAR